MNDIEKYMVVCESIVVNEFRKADLLPAAAAAVVGGLYGGIGTASWKRARLKSLRKTLSQQTDPAQRQRTQDIIDQVAKTSVAKYVAGGAAGGAMIGAAATASSKFH